MTSSVTLRPRARRDLLEQYAYFGEHSSLETADRFLAAVENTCLLLATQPDSGTLYQSPVPRLAGLRRFPVSGFRRYSIFYFARRAGIEVLRVLHGARDIESVFSEGAKL